MDAKKLIKLGAVLLAVFALLTIIVSLINVNKSISTMTKEGMTAEEIASVEAELSKQGMDMDSALSLIMVIAYVTIGILSIFSVIKIVIGLLILKNANRSHKFYMTWSVIFLIFGLLGLKSGIFNMLGLCNIISGVAAPILLIVGSVKLRKENIPETVSESESENQ